MSKTVVLQSHTQPLPTPWLQTCIDSVKHWSEIHNYDYQFHDDSLFEHISKSLLKKLENQIVIATDLARLKLLQNYLNNGYHRVIWCDADFLIFKPEKFKLIDEKYALGREVWIQQSKNTERKLVSKIKVHNAFMMFEKNNTFLDFYSDTAERLLNLNTGSMPPQYIGPKLLTALHNIIQCPVQESAGMLSPLVIKDLNNNSSYAKDLFLKTSTHHIHAANLCNSLYLSNETTEDEIKNCIANLFDEKLYD